MNAITEQPVVPDSKQRDKRIIAAARAIFTEALEAGQRGEFFDQAWEGSNARVRLMQPSQSAMAAIERRDRTLYFFEEGHRAGMAGVPADHAWPKSYSLVIAQRIAERVYDLPAGSGVEIAARGGVAL